MALHVAVFSVRVSEQSVMHRSLCSQNPCVFHSHMFRTSGTESILLRSFPMSRHKQTVQLFEPTILPQSLCSALSSAYPFSSSSMSTLPLPGRTSQTGPGPQRHGSWGLRSRHIPMHPHLHPHLCAHMFICAPAMCHVSHSFQIPSRPHSHGPSHFNHTKHER